MAERWRRSGREYIISDLIQDLILDLRSWLPDIPVDLLRGWTELIKSKSLWAKAFDQLFPEADLWQAAMSENQCLKFYYNTLC